MNEKPTLAALLVDLENLYLAFKDKYRNPADATLTCLQALREHLKGELDISPVVGRAYAPLDYSTSRLLINDLALLGITPVHVFGHVSKNSADLMLAIDAIEILFRRSDIETFVIVGGDRDYIPVVERITQNARRILMVSPKHSMSGDLLTIIGEENFLDPTTLFPPGRLRPLDEPRDGPVAAEVPQDGADETGDDDVGAPAAEEAAAPTSPPSVPPPAIPTPANMDEVAKLVEDSYELEDLKTLTKLILKFRDERKIQEVWLGPFFRMMNDSFPLKSNAQRKELLTRLEEVGAVRIEERPRSDEGGTYAVLLVQWGHPLVLEMNPG